MDGKVVTYELSAEDRIGIGIMTLIQWAVLGALLTGHLPAGSFAAILIIAGIARAVIKASAQK